MNGLIVIGYQGIGKTTLCNNYPNFIDLESSCFLNGEFRHHDWYIYYCQMAKHLANHGYTVMIASHKCIRGYFIEDTDNSCKVVCCCPCIDIKDEWIAKLRSRYELDPSSKNYKAWKNAEASYSENICSIITDSDDLNGLILIEDPVNYSLKYLIENYQRM